MSLSDSFKIDSVFKMLNNIGLTSKDKPWFSELYASRPILTAADIYANVIPLPPQDSILTTYDNFDTYADDPALQAVWL